MDIQKEREAFAKWFATRYPNIQKTIDLHNDHESIVFRNNQAEAWQAAKAQAVPEGYKVVPVNYECVWCGCTELDGWADETMIEPLEPAND